MSRNQTRRSFLESSIAAAGLLGLGSSFSSAFAEVSGKPKAGKIGDFKISLAEWSLHKQLFAKQITNLDFPKVARETFGIDGIEFVNQFFKDKARDSPYLKDLKKRADDQGVKCLLIMIDGEGDMSDPSAAARDKAVAGHKKWVDAAAELGCHSIRINTGNHYDKNDVANVAESCGRLTDYGDSNKINIICENHGGPSSDPDALLALIDKVNRPRFGTLPDFGNFNKKRNGVYQIDIYDALARLMTKAKAVSAKSYDFDKAGNEKTLDFARIMKIVTDAGYSGYVGIEYEGSRLPENDGIIATKKLLESLRGADYVPSA